MSAVTVETEGAVALVGLNRPEKLNAINDDVLDGLFDAIERIGDDAAIGVGILFGHGRAFSAGGDIKAMDAMNAATFDVTIGKYMAVARAFRACPVPVIAAVHGHALAGGFELALICDVRLASSDASFGLPDTPLGLSPTSGMTYLLPRVVGLGRAMHLTLSAESIDAEEALRIGLVSRVFAPDRLMAEALAYARRIADYPRIGVINSKAGFVRALDADFASATEAERRAEVACFRDERVRVRFRDFIARRRS